MESKREKETHRSLVELFSFNSSLFLLVDDDGRRRKHFICLSLSLPFYIPT